MVNRFVGGCAVSERGEIKLLKSKAEMVRVFEFLILVCILFAGCGSSSVLLYYGKCGGHKKRAVGS